MLLLLPNVLILLVLVLDLEIFVLTLGGYMLLVVPDCEYRLVLRRVFVVLLAR